MLIFKATIWALLLSSLLIFVLGALLSFKRVRDLLSQMSESVNQDLAAAPTQDLRRKLYEYLLRMFFLGSNGRVSRWKTLALAVAGVASLALAADLIDQDRKAGVSLLLGAVMAVPMHWLVEHRCVVWFFRTYKRLSRSALIKQVILATLASLAGSIVISIAAVVGLVGVVVLAMLALGGRFDLGFLLLAAPMVVHGYTIFGLLLIDTLLGLEVALPNRGGAIALLFVSVAPTFFAMLLWLAVAVISKNRYVLTAVRWVLTQLGSLTAPILLGFSYLIFRHAIDLMQAYSFLSM